MIRQEDITAIIKIRDELDILILQVEDISAKVREAVERLVDEGYDEEEVLYILKTVLEELQ